MCCKECAKKIYHFGVGVGTLLLGVGGLAALLNTGNVLNKVSKQNERQLRIEKVGAELEQKQQRIEMLIQKIPNRNIPDKVYLNSNEKTQSTSSESSSIQ